MKPVTLLLATSVIVTSLSLAGSALSAPISAPMPQAKNIKPIIPQITKALIWAQETGALAGGASFCKVEPEILDDYISRAMAKIASTSQDEEDLIISRVEFNNVKSRATVEMPSGGCAHFLTIFKRENARMD